MAPSNGNGRGSGHPGSRKVTRPSVVPAIPLPLMARRSRPQSAPRPQHEGQASPLTERPSVNTSADSTPPTSSPGVTTPMGEAAETVSTPPETATKQNTSDLVGPVPHPLATSAPAVRDLGIEAPAALDLSERGADSSGPSSATFLPSTSPPLPHPDNFQFPTSTPPFAFPPGVENLHHPVRPLPQPLDPRHPLHQPHPSEVSLVFSPHDSNNTSPAPLTGGIPPPPGAMVYRTYIGPPPGMGDCFGPPPPFSGASGGHPTLPPLALGPSSPHSFHGSQSSAHAEENGFTQNATNSGQNGHVAAYRDGPPIVSPTHYPGHWRGGPAQGSDHQRDRLLRHIQDSFLNPEFADCLLYMFYEGALAAAAAAVAGDRSPSQFVGYRSVLAQSPLLKRLFRSPATTQNGPLVTYNIVFADPDVTSKSVHMALGYLYGRALEDIPIGTNDAESRKKGLALALALISTGSFLNLPYVELRGVEQMGRYIDWSNIDKALSFCLRGTRAESFVANHGDPSAPAVLGHMQADVLRDRQLLGSVAAFISQNFPPGFVLDRTVSDTAYSRVPTAPASPSSSAPTIAHGSSGTSSTPDLPQRPASSRVSQDPRLAQIRFGDLSPPTANGNVSNGISEPTTQTHRSGQAPAGAEKLASAVSRILLNLPHDCLRHVLESNDLGDLSGWVRTDDRRKIVHEIVAEREVRRVRALDALREGRVPHSEGIFKSLERCDPRALTLDDEWGTVGWKEEVLPGTSDAPRIFRRWVFTDITAASS